MVQQDTNGGVAYIWDPATGQGHRADPPANIWCGGQVYLADGRLLFIGGTLSFNGGQNYSGLNQLYIFDPSTETWTRQVDMRHGRWYPTGMRMPDGRVLITSGWDETRHDDDEQRRRDLHARRDDGQHRARHRPPDPVLPALAGAARRTRPARRSRPVGLGLLRPGDLQLRRPGPPARVAGRIRQRHAAPGTALGGDQDVRRGRRRHPQHARLRHHRPRRRMEERRPAAADPAGPEHGDPPGRDAPCRRRQQHRNGGPSPARDAPLHAGREHLDAARGPERAARLPLDGAPAPRRPRLVGRRQHRVRRRQRQRHRSRSSSRPTSSAARAPRSRRRRPSSRTARRSRSRPPARPRAPCS